MFEHRRQPVLHRSAFVVRQARFFGVSALVMLFSLGIGTLGYREIEGLSWLDSIYSAAMILTGMGPVGPLKTEAGKIFVTIYALFSGVVFLSSGALIIAPIFHRVIHRLHYEDVVGTDGGASGQRTARKPSSNQV